MAKKAKEKKRRPINPDAEGIFFIALAFLSFLSLFSFSFLEPSRNWLGYVGYIAALGGEYLFGLGAYLIPCYLFWLGARILTRNKNSASPYEHLYFFILLGSMCMLLTVFASSYPDRSE